MPPKTRLYDLDVEDRIEQALTDLHKVLYRGQNPNVARTAREYFVDKYKLRRRFLGITTGEKRPPSHRKLTDVQEASIIEIIRRSDESGVPTRQRSIPQIANTILKKAHGKKRGPAPIVGINWARKFEKRHPEIYQRKIKPLDIDREMLQPDAYEQQVANHLASRDMLGAPSFEHHATPG